MENEDARSKAAFGIETIGAGAHTRGASQGRADRDRHQKHCINNILNYYFKFYGHDYLAIDEFILSVV